MYRWYRWVLGRESAGDGAYTSGDFLCSAATEDGQDVRSSRSLMCTASAALVTNDSPRHPMKSLSSGARSSSVESWASGSRTLVDSLAEDMVKTTVDDDMLLRRAGSDTDDRRDKTGHVTIDPRSDSISIPELYHQCQNLAFYPHAPGLARRFLLDLLAPVLDSDLSAPDVICSLGNSFDANRLQIWLTTQHKRTAQRFEDYLARRKGIPGSREMFVDRIDAIRWCQQSAVVKYVDGSWVQSAFQSTTGLDVDQFHGPYTASAARAAARVSWQVLSEELGDGDLAKEHCAVYENLMDSLAGVKTPKADEEEFYKWNECLKDGELPNKQPYVAALLQLAMSISPNEFLPEMLGFNLSYEGLPYHLLVTSHELKELKVDPYYFILHISIDNSHSGHSAMARMSVVDLLSSMRHAGVAEAQVSQVWKRVQAGYMLADSYRTTPKLYNETAQDVPDPACWKQGILLSRENVNMATFSADETFGTKIPRVDEATAESALLQIFRSKAAAADGVHCAASAKFGGRRIGEWLQSDCLSGQGGKEFMHALATSPTWIKKDEFSDRSKLIRECEWGGRMFGAFTMSEVDVMRQWARTLADGIRTGGTNFPTVLPSSADLNEAAFKPYIRYLAAGDPQVAHDLVCRARYFDQAIQPLDLTAFFEHAPNFVSAIGLASKLYEQCLRHAHGIRGPFNLDISHWLRGIIDSEDAGQSDPHIQEDLADYLIVHMSRCDLATSAMNGHRIRRILPSLFLSSAPLEWLQSVGPAKLAGPLGMAVIKIQRSLMGFASEENDEETCCYGMDDVIDTRPGHWELAAEMYSDGNDITLSSFRSYDNAALILPAIILSLNTQPTLHLPILLGIQLALNVMLHEPLSQWKNSPSQSWQNRMGDMVMRSRRWIIEAIQIGGSDFECNRRGWQGKGDWAEDVRMGYMIAQMCLLAACAE